MEISVISQKEWIGLFQSVYSGDSTFKDNKSGIFHLVCDKKQAFYRLSRQEIVGVKEKGKLLCACVLIIHQNAPKMLNLAFFEALPDCRAAVNILLAYAAGFGRERGCHILVAAMDGHLNNTIAFPAASGSPTFGESYCPQYYHGYFEDAEIAEIAELAEGAEAGEGAEGKDGDGSFKRVGFTSLWDEAAQVRARIAQDLPRLDKVKAGISLTYGDFGRGFSKTMARYTALNNEIFADHRYYYPRTNQEDRALFQAMRPLLNKENMIFAQCNGKDVGYILWYPDFNELVPVGAGASIGTCLHYRLFGKSTFGKSLQTIKVVEIGVVAKYRRYGTILLLFDKAMASAPDNTRKIVSGWILTDNNKSKGIASRYISNQYRNYYTYEKAL